MAGKPYSISLSQTYLNKNCILYIVFHQQVKAVHKDMFNKRKQLIQNKFRSEMGLLVDVVLQGIYLFYIPLITIHLICI